MLVFRPEHRGAPLDTQVLNLRYYGGAEGNVLVYHPALGVTPLLQQQTATKDDDRNAGKEDGQVGGGGGNGNGDTDDGVTIQLPPPGKFRFLNSVNFPTFMCVHKHLTHIIRASVFKYTSFIVN